MSQKNQLFSAIVNSPVGNSGFEIEGIDDLLVKLTRGKPLKAKSFSKKDLEATVYDKRIGKMLY